MFLKRASMISATTVFLSVASGLSQTPAAADPDTGVPSSSTIPPRILRSSAQSIPGVTRPIREVVLAAPFDAVLTRLYVREGDHVRAGQLIATMDDRVARASVTLAAQAAAQTASIARASAAAEHAQLRFDRTLAAARGGGTNQTEVENAQAELAIAQAELRQAEEARQAAALRLELAQAHLAEREIRAPFTGTILQTHTEDGTTLRVGDAIAELADLTRQRVDLFLAPDAAISVEVGQHYALSIGPDQGVTVSAEARFIEPRVDPASGTIRVAFEINEIEAMPPPGLLARPALPLVLANEPN